MGLNITTFGKFKLLKQIAKGGMAEIFLGCSGSIKSAFKFVVVKRVLSVHLHNKEFNKMFQSEGKIAVNLNHSNIASIHEFGIEKNQYFICMEYISGRNIRQLLKKLRNQKKHLDPVLCAHIIKNVCNGLEYAHNCTDSITGQPLNIIHRDISPQNIMISFNGDVKIIDFGIAKIDNTENTKAGVLKGKFEYMSPEQVRGKDLDRQTDIFSLGNVLWEILVGKKLFTANNEIKLLKTIRDCRIPDLKKINPKIPHRLVEIVNKALSPNKNLRYKTMGEMGNDISIFMNKCFPNFTHTNFSTFIKELYVEEILEERKNLKTYSQNLLDQKKKLSSIPRKQQYQSTFIGYMETAKEENSITNTQNTQTNPSFSTQVLDSVRHTITQTQNTDNEFTHNQEITSTEFDDKLEQSTAYTQKLNQTSSSSSQITSDGLRNSISLADNTMQTSNSNVAPKISRKSGVNIIEADDKEPIKQSYTPWRNNLNSHHYKLQKRKKRKNTKKLVLSALILVIISVAYVFQGNIKDELQKLTQKKNQKKIFNEPISKLDKFEPPNDTSLKETKRKPTAKQAQPKLTQQIPTKTAVNIPARRNIFITTKPSGAQLYINSKKIKPLTPTSILIPINTFQLIIKKQGYHDQIVELSPNSIKNKIGFTLKKNKQKKPKKNVIIIRQ